MNPRPASSRTLFGLPRLPARYAVLVMPLLLSILMTFVVSMVSTLRSIGLAPGFMIIWLGAWGSSWLVAFPTLLAVLVQLTGDERWMDRMIKSEYSLSQRSPMCGAPSASAILPTVLLWPTTRIRPPM